MDVCVVSGCDNSSLKEKTDLETSKLNFHQFPNDLELRAKWVQAIKRDNWEPTTNSRVCSAHFAEDAFEEFFAKRLLKKDAVPSLFLPQQPSKVKTEVVDEVSDSDEVEGPVDIKDEIDVDDSVYWSVKRELQAELDNVKVKQMVPGTVKEEEVVEEDRCNFYTLILDMDEITESTESELQIEGSQLEIEDDAIREEEEELHANECDEEISSLDDVQSDSLLEGEDTSSDSSDDSIISTIVNKDLEKTSETKQLFQCKTCSKSFTRKFTFVEHMRLHTGETPYQCGSCPEKFSRIGDFRLHKLKVHDKDKLLQCELCDKSFIDKHSLDDHMRTHTGEKPFQCEVCGKIFAQKRLLCDHRRRVHNERRFMCKFCDKSFVYSHERSSHEKRIHTGEITTRYQCELCSSTFRYMTNLRRHILETHRGVKAFQCEVCSKSFTQKSSLIKHLRLHTGEKPFQCDVCKRAFTSKVNLIRHMSLHTGEKPYKCEFCDKRFISVTTKQYHQNKHTGTTFQCSNCGHTSSSKANLSTHMITHSGEKPFECGVCNTRFTQKSSLITHSRIHTGEKPFQCPNCGRRFSVKCSMMNHQKTHNR